MLDYDDDESGGEEEGPQEEVPQDPNADYFKPNLQFKSYASLFENLTKAKKVATAFPILSVIITYDSSRAILVTKKDDREAWIR